MYHIKPDRRSQRTAEEICQGLLECLKEKPLSAVTVTDIHRATSISRATFYRLFDNIDDILEYMCVQPSPQEFVLAEQADGDPTRLFTQILALGLEHHTLVKALIDNGRYDLVVRFAEHRYQLLRGLSQEDFREMDRGAYDYMISALAMNMVSIMATWLRRGQIDTPADIARYTAEYMKFMGQTLSQPGQ